MVPHESLRVEEREKARMLVELVDALEELDDVQRVHGNFEIDDAVLRELGA